MIWVVTDFAADLPAPVVEQLGIVVVGGRLSLNGDVYRAGPELAATDFYSRWRAPGQALEIREPSVNDLGQVYQSILDQQPTADIISVHASGALAETVQRARVAAAATNDARIKVVDSMALSIGIGLLAREAAEMARQRRSAGAIAETLGRMRASMQGFIVAETAELLHESGQLGAVDRMIGGLLAVKPILAVQEGAIRLHDQRRSRADALQALSDSVIKSGFAHSQMRIAIAHALCEDEAHVLAREILRTLKPDALLVTEIGPENGALAAPGTLAAFWASAR